MQYIGKLMRRIDPQPILDVLARFEDRQAPWPDVFVLELSSFQLETTSSLAPVAAAVLNVTDNHLDRYSGLDAYADWVGIIVYPGDFVIPRSEVDENAKTQIFTPGQLQGLLAPPAELPPEPRPRREKPADAS